LQSRYYNLEWCRFVSADAIVGRIGELLTHNMFSYCFNRPIMFEDSSGFDAEDIGRTYKQIPVPNVILEIMDYFSPIPISLFIGVLQKTSVTINKNKPIEVVINGKKESLRVDVEPDLNKIQIQSGHGKKSSIDIRINPKKPLDDQIPKNIRRSLSKGQYNDLMKYLKRAVDILKSLK